MAVVNRIFFDTSTLLGGLIEIGPGVESAQAVMAAIAEDRVTNPVTAWHCCLEFYAVATRLPPGYRLLPQDTLRLMEDGIFGRFEVRQLPEEGRLPLLQMASNHRVVGGRVYDAHIGAIAVDAGATVLVTENINHFSDLRAYGVDVLTADEYLTFLSPPKN
jgi:hypothetical protein